MPCYKTTALPNGFTTTGKPVYKTEAECNRACQEGACCEGTTCTVKPQCQCQGTGKTFKGAGTTCSPNPCTHLCSASCSAPAEVRIHLLIGNAVRVPGNLILGNQTDDPYSNLLPSWSRDCIDALPSALSGTYVLRYTGLGPAWAEYKDIPEYKFSNSSILLDFLWPCNSFFDPVKNQLFPGIGNATVNAWLEVGTPRKECVFEGGGAKGLTGTSISQSCSTTLTSLNTQNNLTAGDGLFVRFVKYFVGYSEIVGGASGVKFPITASVS